MRDPRRRSARGLVAIGLLLAASAAGCAARQPVPPGPTLPEVRFVPPCDPDAAIALTAKDEKALVLRDQLLQQRIQQLEGLLRGDD